MEVRGLNAVVVGAARTGVAAAKLLARKGAVVTLSDCDVPENESDIRFDLKDLAVRFEFGGHPAEGFAEYDLVVLSPGVPPSIVPVHAAERAGVPVMSELELASRFTDASMVAITGTNGKTTATTLADRMIRASGISTVLCGNNDLPLSEVVMMSPSPEVIVAEVSSYQLERIERFHPHVAVLLNVTHDHFERHGDLHSYRQAKLRIFENQNAKDTAVLNGDDPVICSEGEHLDANVLLFSLEREVTDGVFVRDDRLVQSVGSVEQCYGRVADVALIGRHNLANTLAALCVAATLGLPRSACEKTMHEFRGLEHRMEVVAKKRGVTFINDSKATNVDAVEKALTGMTMPVVLIAGGQGKGSDYGVLRSLVESHVKGLVLVGEDAPIIERAFADIKPIHHAGSIEKAVAEAYGMAGEGDCVLLSPACASFDMFRDFEERGARFKKAVWELDL